ncbi:LysE family translocator [Thomasclavelia sp.]
MIDNYLLKGIFIGVMFGIPVGVVGVLTVQRTLTRGFWAGVISGLGSSFADVFYASLSIFSITLISDFLLQYQQLICIVGCIMIISIGIGIIKKDSQDLSLENKVVSSQSSFISSFMITLTNPATILSFMVIFSTFGVSGNEDMFHKILLVTGIFIGTAFWWILLSGLVKWSQKLISDSLYKRLNTFFGVAIIILGIVIVSYSLII